MQPKDGRFESRTEIDDVTPFVLRKKIFDHLVKIIISGDRSKHRVF